MPKQQETQSTNLRGTQKEKKIAPKINHFSVNALGSLFNLTMREIGSCVSSL
jgi:hypothetical protein